MAATQLRINGLADLRAALKQLPPELVREAGPIVTAAADATLAETDARYPERSGALRRGLQRTAHGDIFGVSASVRSRARHAHLYERGSKPRQNRRGKNLGTMPAADVLIPIAIRHRQLMLAALIELVRRAGFTVTT